MFSIIICTYNPELFILNKLLDAVLNFKFDSTQYEIILVDNNSLPSIESIPLMIKFLETEKRARLIKEKAPGLTAARIAGIKSTNNNWIIFFDDDNEPAEDYLTSAIKLIQTYPQVGLWGPGKLRVEYLGKKENPFLTKMRWLFQQRNYEGTHIDNNSIQGSEYYPFGTGMIVRKDILLEYKNRVEAGTYSMSDRSGKNLMSAGDIQILFTGLQMGYYAGSCSSLNLTHLIDEKKSKANYINRLIYALNSSQQKAYIEVFPDRKLTGEPVSNLTVFKTMISGLRTFKMNKEHYTLPLFLSRKLGELNSRIVAYNLKKPTLLWVYEKLIRW